jgi:hypothetical protein
MGRFVSATGQFLLATYEQFSCPPMGSFSCPLTVCNPYRSAALFESVDQRRGFGRLAAAKIECVSHAARAPSRMCY